MTDRFVADAVTERRIPYPAVWALFVTAMIVGAGMLLSDRGAFQVIGLLLLLAPVLLLGLLMAAYYLKNRAMPP